MIQKVFKQGEYPLGIQNGPFAPNKIFFGKKHYYNFDVLLGTFYCAKLKQILRVDPELRQCIIFGPKIIHLPGTKIFLV